MSQRLLSTIFIIFLITLITSAQDQPESPSNQPSLQTANNQPSPAEDTGKTTHQSSQNQTAIQQQPKGEEAAISSEEKQTTEPAPEIPKAAQVQQNSNPPTQQNNPQNAQKQQEQTAKTQAVQAQAAKAPENVQAIVVQSEQQKIPQSMGQNHLQNLTEEQKAQLLREESIRAQLHANDELSLSKLANLTNQQTLSLSQKLKIQASAAYQRARQQHLQIQRQNKEQLAKLIKQQKLSFTQQIVAKQKFKLDQFHAHQHHHSLSFNDFMFDMDPYAQEDFMITIPVSQPMGYQVTVYKNHDGVYLKSVEYDEQQPKAIKIYENHNRVVLESSFFFSDAAIFKADGNSTYTIRFVNSKQHILVMFKLSHAVEANRLDQKATSQDIKSHTYRSKQLYLAFTEKFYSLDTSLTLQVSNRKKLTVQLKNYSIYTFIQIIIFIVVVLVQVKLIKQLLGSSTIV